MRRFLLCTWVALSVPAAAGVYSAGAALALAPSRAEAADDLEARLARAERLAGLTSIQGPGLVVVLRHSPIRAPRGVDRRTLMIHDQDLNAVLNALRVAGAEALAVGGRDAAVPERVLVSTAARDDRNGVTVNGVSLQPPYRVTAVGDPRALRAELFRESGVVRKAGLDTLQMIDVQEAQDLVVPAARGGSDSAAASVPRTSPGTEYRAPREERVERPTTPRVPAGRVGQPGTVAAVVRRNQSGGTYIAPPPGPRTVHEEDIQPYRAAQPDPRVATALPRPPGPPTIHEAERPSSRRVRPQRRVSTPLPRPPGPGTIHEADESPAPEVQPERRMASRGTGATLPPPPGPRTIHEDEEPVAPAPRPIRATGSTRRTAPPVEQRTAPARASGGPIFGGRGLAKYHLVGCRFGERIEQGERVFFSSAGEAEADLRTRCTICQGAQASR